MTIYDNGKGTHMNVKIIDVANGIETTRSECDLRECFPDDETEYYVAKGALNKEGRYWTGGGAAPLVLLMKA